MPAPTPAAGEVVIKTHAVGVNRADFYQLEGLYPVRDLSPVPGLESAGEVIAIGDGVSGWRIGDRVMALTKCGSYAEMVAAPADLCLAVPADFSYVEAAAMPEALFTCQMALMDIGGLQAAEKVLIYGGSSGIGTIAIQLAREAGAKVYATATTPEKMALCQKYGAETYDYLQPDWAEQLKKTSGGIDVILDMVGGDYAPINLKLAAAGGRIITIALQAGRTTAIDMGALFAKQLRWEGALLTPRPLATKTAYALEISRKWLPLLEKRRIFPHINAVKPFMAAPEALEIMRSRTHMGKIVLNMNS